MEKSIIDSRYRYHLTVHTYRNTYRTSVCTKLKAKDGGKQKVSNRKFSTYTLRNMPAYLHYHQQFVSNNYDELMLSKENKGTTLFRALTSQESTQQLHPLRQDHPCATKQEQAHPPYAASVPYSASSVP